MRAAAAKCLALAEQQEASLQTWQKLPPWYWYHPATRLRPGATALLVHPTARMGDEPMPLLSTQFYGLGPVLLLSGDETWRWRYNVEEQHFARFWGQVVYQLGLPHMMHGSPRAQLALEHPKPMRGQPGAVYARLLDESFHPLGEPHVAVRLVNLDPPPGGPATREMVLEAMTGRPGEYRAMLANDVAGQFELQLERPVSAALPFEVAMPPQNETEPNGMAEQALREAAGISGGRFYREEDLYRLPDHIESRERAIRPARGTAAVEPAAVDPVRCLDYHGMGFGELSNLS